MAASKIFEDALAMAKAKDKLHTLPSLYVHFSRLKRMVGKHTSPFESIH